MVIDPRRGRVYQYLDAPLANDQGVTGQEVDTPPPPPPRYDNADGYTPENTAMPDYIPLPIEEYPYDDVPRSYDRGPTTGMHPDSPMADADDPVMVEIGRWQRGVYERGNEVRYTAAGVFEVDPGTNRIISAMPTGTEYI